jgi:hypothetical protein
VVQSLKGEYESVVRKKRGRERGKQIKKEKVVETRNMQLKKK